MLDRLRSAVRTAGAGQVVAFCVALVLVLLYALRGGTYDLVARHESAIAIWWVLGLGVATKVLPRGQLRVPTWVGAVLLVALAAWTAISLSWTESEELTSAEMARVLHHAGVFLLLACLIDRRTWRPAAAGLAAGATLVCVLAVTSRLWPGPFPADEVARVFGIRRLGYPFNYWNALAAWGAMSVAMALAWSAHAESVAARAAALAGLPWCGLAIYLTYSRAGAIGTTLGVAVVVGLAAHRWLALGHAVIAAGASGAVIAVARRYPELTNGTDTSGALTVVVALLGASVVCAFAALLSQKLGIAGWQLPRRHARVAALVAAVGAAVVLIVAVAPAANDAWEEFRTFEPRQVDDPAERLGSFEGARYSLWSSALDAFEENPVKGLGAGTFEFWWSSKSDLAGFERDAHSLYFEQLAELGLPGLLLTLAALLCLAVVAARAVRAAPSPAERGASLALLAAFLVYLLHAGVDWMWESTAVTALALAAAACAAASLGDGAPARPLRLAPRVGLSVLAVVALLVQLPGLVSTSLVRDSQEHFRENDLDKALAEAEDAVEAEPWAATPYVQRALLAEAAADHDAAASDLQAAIEREPTNWRHRLLLARIEAARGRPEAALEAWREAKRLRPRSAFFTPAEGTASIPPPAAAAPPTAEPAPTPPPDS